MGFSTSTIEQGINKNSSLSGQGGTRYKTLMGPAGKNSFMEQDMYYEEDEGEQGGSIEDNSAGRFDSVDSKKEKTK